MYPFRYTRPASLEEAVERLGAAEDGQLLAGGQTLLPAMKQRLAQPSDLVDLGGIASLAGIGRAGDAIVIGRDDPPPRGRVVGHGRRGRPRARGARGRHRRPPGEELRHPRRLGRERGSRRGTIRRPSWPWAPRCAPANARSRPSPSSPGCSRPPSARPRSSPRWRSRSPPGPPTPSSPTPPPGTPLPGSSSPRGPAASGSRSPGPGRASSGRPRWRRPSPGGSRRNRWPRSRYPPDGLNTDVHASAEYRAHLVTVMAKRAVAAALRPDRAPAARRG